MSKHTLFLTTLATIILGSALQVVAQDKKAHDATSAKDIKSEAGSQATDDKSEKETVKAAGQPAGEKSDKTTKEPTGDAISSLWPTTRIVAIVAVLFFGLVLLIVVSLIILKTKVRWTPYSVVRIFGLTLIIFTTVLVMFVPEAEVSKAIIGLLGAVAGYLLGKDSPQGDIAEDTDQSEETEE